MKSYEDLRNFNVCHVIRAEASIAGSEVYCRSGFKYSTIGFHMYSVTEPTQ